MTDAPFHVWIHIQGANGDISGNAYESHEQADRTGQKRADDPSNLDVISIDASTEGQVRVQVLKGAIAPFRARLEKLFSGRWQEANV
jgi:hypothetical protein